MNISHSINDDEIDRDLQRLSQHAEKVEQRFPLLHFKTNDDLSQIKFFILQYYEPILTTYEI